MAKLVSLTGMGAKQNGGSWPEAECRLWSRKLPFPRSRDRQALRAVGSGRIVPRPDPSFSGNRPLRSPVLGWATGRANGAMELLAGVGRHLGKLVEPRDSLHVPNHPGPHFCIGQRPTQCADVL